jgi:hypothetical protein
MFFDLLLDCASHPETCSLAQASSKVQAMHRLHISKQSLDDRYTKQAVVFVKEVLIEILERQLSTLFCADFFPQFNKIRIKDSTRFLVADKLKENFKGTGGSPGTSEACVCIQYEYDARSGKVLDLNITGGIRSDSADATETKNMIDQNDLVLRDLGYFNLSVLTGFADKGAFYVSRLNTSILVFKPENEEKIGFGELYKQMREQKLSQCEKIVLVGKDKKVKLRLIVEIVPGPVYEQRIRKINQRNKDKGWTTSVEYKERCRFNMFITNVPTEDLSTEAITLLYRLRWQVELMFKNWKSVARIDKIRPMKYERFACLLFAKLVLIIVNLQIVNNMKRYYFNKTKLILSENKCFKTLKDSLGILRGIWKEKRKISEKKLMSLVRLLASNHWKEKRKNRQNYIEIISLFICKSI